MFKTHLVNRYNVYKGGKQLIGVAGELTLPEVTNLTDTMEGAGTGGNAPPSKRQLCSIRRVDG